MNKQSRREFLKNLGKAGAAVGVVAITGLPPIGEPGAIPPATRSTWPPLIGSDNWYEFYQEFGQEIAERYRCEAAIYKSVRSPYALSLYLNGHVKYLAPHYNSGLMTDEARNYFTNHFEDLAMRARSIKVLLLVQDKDSHVWHIAHGNNACCGYLEWNTFREYEKLPDNLCPKCVVNSNAFGLAHPELRAMRNAIKT